MKIKTNTGFALVGTLAVLLGGLTLILSTIKLSTRELNKAKTKSTEHSEKVLKQAVQQVLSQETDCKNNLNPILSEIKKIESKGRLILESGEDFKEGFVHIVDMKITEDKKTFYLYYSKPSLGENKTRKGKACTKTDLSGCYYLSCKMNYQCADGLCDSAIDSVSQCNIIGQCSFLGKPHHVNTAGCEPDKVLSGIKMSSEKDNKENIKCTHLTSTVFNSIPRSITEGGKTYLTGFAGFSRNPDTKAIQASVTKLATECPDGKYPIRKSNGEIECEILCTGGSTLDPITNLCQCPTEKPQYKQGACHPCQGGQNWDKDNKQCKCPEGQTFSDGKCHECPEGQTMQPFIENQHSYKGGKITVKETTVMKCHECPEGQSLQTYSANQFFFKGGKNVAYKKIKLTICDCPNEKPYFYDKGCHRCAKNRVLFNGRCCPKGGHISNGQCCPKYTREVKALIGGNVSNTGLCCNSGSNWWASSGIDSRGQPFGECCRAGHFCLPPWGDRPPRELKEDKYIKRKKPPYINLD